MPTKNRKRIDILDGLRGLVVIMMVTFHFLYDIEMIFGVELPFFEPKYTDIILIIFPTWFFVISGICTAFSRNILKRGVILFFIGQIITIVTAMIIPDELIVFGAISSIGCCMMIYAFAKNILDKIPSVLSFFCFIILFVVFSKFSTTNTLNLIFTEIPLNFEITNPHFYAYGFPTKAFYSADYFPLIPYFFAFVAGTALAKPITQNKFPQWFYNAKMPILNKIGKHSFVIYIVHQPLIFATLTIINNFKG